MLPPNATEIPIILFKDVVEWKNKAPVIITKMGVREFKVPVSALSITVSAKQNK